MLGNAMNQQRTESNAIANPSDARLDLRQRDIVDHGISMQYSSNTMCAVEYLRSCDVHPHVIARVLLEPKRGGRDD
jgi:hypothetical protein